jgi:DNA-binding NarL/FixJ family response regulator
LVRELRKLRPDIRFVVSTGLEPSSKLRELAELGIPGALPKPCSAYDAIMAVQKVLAA